MYVSIYNTCCNTLLTKCTLCTFTCTVTFTGVFKKATYLIGVKTNKNSGTNMHAKIGALIKKKKDK